MTERWHQRQRQTAKHVESPRIHCCLHVKWKMWIVSSVPSCRDAFEACQTAALCPFFLGGVFMWLWGWRSSGPLLWEESHLSVSWRKSMTLTLLGARLSYVTFSLVTSRWGRGQLFDVQLQYNAGLCNSTQCTLAYNTWEIVTPSKFIDVEAQTGIVVFCFFFCVLNVRLI